MELQGKLLSFLNVNADNAFWINVVWKDDKKNAKFLEKKSYRKIVTEPKFAKISAPKLNLEAPNTYIKSPKVAKK